MIDDNYKIDEWCMKNFLKIGLPANLLGFKYLRTAVKLAYNDASLLSSYTKKLYPAVGQVHSEKANVVERGIRNAIEAAINRRHTVGINEVFEIEVFDYNYKPSNSELISLLTEKLNMDMH